MNDLNIICNAMQHDGIGKHGIGVANLLKNDLSICAQLQQPNDWTDIPEDVVKIMKTPHVKSKIDWWCWILGVGPDIIHKHADLDGEIKIAYSMIESTAIPPLWVDVLNKYFHMVVVPDEWLINVYKTSGVKIPIFVMKLGMIIDPEYFNYNHVKNDVFTFGMTGSLLNRKNHIKLMRAFKDAFGYKKDVKLKLHGRWGEHKSAIITEYKNLKMPNIELATGPISVDVMDKFMKSLDCYVFISKGEAISLTPREQIALGKPVILSNNTGHKIMCDKGYALPVKANIKTPAYYECFKRNLGSYYDVEQKDVTRALLEVYNNYDKYQRKAISGREWVKEQTWEALKPYYMSLLKPTNIIKSTRNAINKDSLEIQDENLYNLFCKTFPKE